MKCPKEIIAYMHEYLDEELQPKQEEELRKHLQECDECQMTFNELKKSEALVRSIPFMPAPADFTANVMAKLPKEKKKVGIQRWFKHHPVLTAASLFLLLMSGTLFSAYNQEDDFSVSKQENVIVQNDTVIVPKGEVVKGDLVVKNGNIEIEGEVQGDVTVINGEKYLASAGKVTGEIEEVNEAFDWLWYQIKSTAKSLVQVFQSESDK